MLRSDWAWLQKYGDSTLPSWDDTQQVSIVLTIIPKTSWSSLLKRARARCIGLERILVDRDTVRKFQDQLLSVFVPNFGSKPREDERGDGEEDWTRAGTRV